MSDSDSSSSFCETPPALIIAIVQSGLAARCSATDPAAKPISDAELWNQIKVFRPQDAAEALIAGQMLIAHRGANACFRAARRYEPGSAQASRLRRDGIAQQRLLITGARLLLQPRPRRQPAAAPPKGGVPRLAYVAPRQEARPPAPARPASPGPQARAPRWEELTMEQRRAYYGYKDAPPKAEKKT